ncbi:MAG TPA: EamA family transporter [Rhodanobacteraceae bacterium]|nr:EamA family transporter [Rhodanobacteraceae bacterium]
MTSSARAPERAAWIALAVLTVVWSLNWTVMKSALDYSGPFTFSALRYVAATIVLFVLMALRRESLRMPPLLPTVLIGLAQTTGFQALVQWALVGGGAGKTALLAYAMPFWMVPLAWLLLHEKPRPMQWMCIGLAAIGLVFVIEPWHALGSVRSVVLALAGGLAWAIGTVLSKRVFQRTQVSPLQLTAWQMLFGTLVLVVIALIVPERTVEWAWPFIGALAYNALLSSGIAWALWLLIVQRLPTQIAGLTSLLVPIAGVLFAWGLLHERPDRAEWIGIGLIGVSLLALNFARRESA